MSATTQRAQVVVLGDVQVDVVIAALREREGTDHLHSKAAGVLADRLQFGEEYVNPVDELVRKTSRKRQLEAELRSVNDRLRHLEETVLEEFTERGITGEKHAATGMNVHTARKVWARISKDDPARKEVTPEERQRACDALRAAGLGDFVRDDFSTQSLSAHFRQQVKEHDEGQRLLPEHERTPLDVADLLPAECVGAIELTDQPTLSVRS